MPSCEDLRFASQSFGQASAHSPALYVVAEQNHWHEAYVFTCESENSDDCHVLRIDLSSLWDMAVRSDALKNNAKLDAKNHRNPFQEEAESTKQTANLPRADFAPSFDSIHISESSRSLLIQIGTSIYQVPIEAPPSLLDNFHQPLSPFIPYIAHSNSEIRADISILVNEASVVYGTPGNKEWLVYQNTSEILCAKYIGQFQDYANEEDSSFCFSDQLKGLRPVALGHKYIAALLETEKTDKKEYDHGFMFLLEFPKVSYSATDRFEVTGQGRAIKLSNKSQNYTQAIFAQKSEESSPEDRENGASHKYTSDVQLVLSALDEIEVFELPKDSDQTGFGHNGIRANIIHGNLISGTVAFGEVNGLSAISPNHGFLLYQTSYKGVAIHQLTGSTDLCVVRRGNQSNKTEFRTAGWSQDGSIFVQSKTTKRGNNDLHAISRHETPQSSKRLLYENEENKATLTAVPSSGNGTLRQPWAIAKINGSDRSLFPMATPTESPSPVNNDCIVWPKYSTILDMNGNSLDIANLHKRGGEDKDKSSAQFRLEIARKASPLTQNCNRAVNLVDSSTGLPFAFAELRRSKATKLCVSTSNLLWTSICQSLPDEESKGWGGTNNNGADHRSASGSGPANKSPSDDNIGENPVQ